MIFQKKWLFRIYCYNAGFCKRNCFFSTNGRIYVYIIKCLIISKFLKTISNVFKLILRITKMFLNHVIQNIYFAEKKQLVWKILKFCFLIFGKMYFSLTVSIYSKKWNTLCINVMFFQAFTTCYETFAEYELYFQTFSIFIPSCIHYDIFICTRQIFDFFFFF